MSDSFVPRPAPGSGTLTIRPLLGCTGLMLTGEADIASRDVLRTALAALRADGSGQVHLDLAGLRFIDVSCTRELVALAGRDRPVRIIAHDPPACLLRITALICPEAEITILARAARTPEPPAAARTRTRRVTAAAAARGGPAAAAPGRDIAQIRDAAVSRRLRNGGSRA